MIAVVTGGARPEHVRFAYQAQAELGERLLGWWQVAAAAPPAAAAPGGGSALGKLRALWAQGGARGVLAKMPDVGRAALRAGGETLARRTRATRLTDAENRLFSAEIAALVTRVRWPAPERDPAGLTGARVVIALDAAPAVAGALLLTSSASALPGLYHRRLDWVIAQVRLAGRVVLEGWPTLLPTDSPESCRLRVAALAGELLIEAAREAAVTGHVTERLLGAGRPDAPLPADAALRVERDFRDGWLGAELQRARHY